MKIGSSLLASLVLGLPLPFAGLVCGGSEPTPSVSDTLLPDTGQTRCYTASGSEIGCEGTGQDGAFAFHPMQLTGAGDGTVLDAVTGLVWQRQDDGQWHAWAEAGPLCDGLTLGGRDDWRLPGPRELASLVDYGRSDPATDAAAFPDTAVDHYWSTTYVKDGTAAWGVDFRDGYVSNYQKGSAAYVRCVAGDGPTAPALTDLGDGTVKDAVSGLVWAQAQGEVTDWEGALDRCGNLSLAGHEDWRLPDVRELLSLVDEAHAPSLDEAAFPGADVAFTWSSTSWTRNPSEAWGVDFTDGSVYVTEKPRSGAVRCVR